MVVRLDFHEDESGRLLTSAFSETDEVAATFYVPEVYLPYKPILDERMMAWDVFYQLSQFFPIAADSLQP